MFFPYLPWNRGLNIGSQRIAVRLGVVSPLCALINVRFVERRWMLWAGMGLALRGLTADITGMLPSMTSFIIP